MSVNETENFSKMYDDFADPIFRHCYFRVSDREKAKDLVQETFCKTWSYVVDGGKIVNAKAFLYKVANRLIIDWYRKKKDLSLEKLSETGFDPASGEHQTLVKSAEANMVIKIIDSLDEKYRDVIIMNYVDELPIKEIAEVIGETENNVSVRLHRGMQQLKELINRQPNPNQQLKPEN